MKKTIITCILMVLALVNYAQEVKDEAKTNEKKDEIRVKVKDGQEPDVYIDGEKYNAKIMRLLDSDKIKAITVLKDEKSKSEYNAPNGVILIETKKEDETIIRIKGSDAEIDGNEPKIIIDGVDSDQLELKELSPDDIHSISVVKGEEATKKYNSENGVILVTTKKAHKKKKN